MYAQLRLPGIIRSVSTSVKANSQASEGRGRGAKGECRREGMSEASGVRQTPAPMAISAPHMCRTTSEVHAGSIKFMVDVFAYLQHYPSIIAATARSGEELGRSVIGPAPAGAGGDPGGTVLTLLSCIHVVY